MITAAQDAVIELWASSKGDPIQVVSAFSSQPPPPPSQVLEEPV